jgi:putative heme-binding domain-containing protein
VNPRLGMFASGWLLLSCAAAGAQPMPALSTASAADVATGKRLFDGQCAWCHGADGVGAAGPSLQRATLRSAADDRALVQLIRVGLPGTEMPGFGLSLSETTAWQTAAYVRSLGRSEPANVPGDAKRGAALYVSTGCAACHVIAGAGIGVGPELTTIGLSRGPAHLRESLTKPEAAHPSGYLVVKATSGAGATTRGIRVNEDVFFVHIRDAAGKLHVFEKAKLARLERELQGTLMPSYAQLPPAQLDDLVSYLASLRGLQ